MLSAATEGDGGLDQERCLIAADRLMRQDIGALREAYESAHRTLFRPAYVCQSVAPNRRLVCLPFTKVLSAGLCFMLPKNAPLV